LHKPKSCPAVLLEPSFEEIKAKEVEQPCLSTGQTDTVTNEQVPKAQLQQTDDVSTVVEKSRRKDQLDHCQSHQLSNTKTFPNFYL
jgi:hypothetical protein